MGWFDFFNKRSEFIIDPQNDETSMKDGLPLVNNELLIHPLDLRVTFSDEHSGVMIGDILNFCPSKMECSLENTTIDHWMPERGILKITKDGYVIKAKVI